MKKTILIASSAMLLMACGPDAAKTKAMSGYAGDVCACAFESTTTEEWEKCNDQRKDFFSKFELDVDDADANKTNDIMFDCLMDHQK
ncbi:MAG: hypothetical protein COA97_10795 [Flavobacteriales bacterium]|nr:MAG: hypothetical protein COA97_10795 [Flavobacteriales bacterium]